MSSAMVVAVLQMAPAFAWKPTTHVFLAEQAIADALDGVIEIPILGKGRVLKYPVEPRALEAIRKFRPYYRAGVLGPDAFPDFLTGQMGPHPDFEGSGVEGGSDSWLRQIWSGFNGSSAEVAFKLGFLTHAAGDVYAHSFVNRYTGGPFKIDLTANFLKHMVIEGYVDKRLPAEDFPKDFFDVSISGIEHTIYSRMIDARPGNAVSRLLPYWGDLIPIQLPQPELGLPPDFAKIPAILSLPRTLTVWRKILVEDLEEQKAALASCALLDTGCSSLFLQAWITYEEHWIEDIDSGLEALPAFSLTVAKALFFNPTRGIQRDELAAAGLTYWNLHLSSMLGAPDFIGENAEAFSKLIESLTPPHLTAAMDAMKRGVVEALMPTALGVKIEQAKKYLESPELHFEILSMDPQRLAAEVAEAIGAAVGEDFGPLPQPVGTHVTLAAFNKDVLRIDDPGFERPTLGFDFRDVPATYNTVLLSKIILLSNKSVNELISDLGGGKDSSGIKIEFKEENIMLGFLHSMDGSEQWNDGMVLAKSCRMYGLIFKPMPDMPCR